MHLILSVNSSLKTLISALICSILLVSCQKDPISTVDCTGVTPTYSADIKPILDGSCATSGCHNSSSQQAGVNLSNYNGASNASSRPSFLGTIQHKKGYNPMPQNSAQLSQDKIDLITCWVQNGSVQ